MNVYCCLDTNYVYKEQVNSGDTDLMYDLGILTEELGQTNDY